MNATAPDTPPSAEDHTYFLTIEKCFLGLRKKAALLTAADWQEAQNWHRQGIPVELIQDVMEKLFDICPKNTFITITADHGELFGEEGYFGHGPIMHPKVHEVPFVEGKLR